MSMTKREAARLEAILRKYVQAGLVIEEYSIGRIRSSRVDFTMSDEQIGRGVLSYYRQTLKSKKKFPLMFFWLDPVRVLSRHHKSYMNEWFRGYSKLDEEFALHRVDKKSEESLPGSTLASG